MIAFSEVRGSLLIQKEFYPINVNIVVYYLPYNPHQNNIFTTNSFPYFKFKSWDVFRLFLCTLPIPSNKGPLGDRGAAASIINSVIL